MISLYRHHIGIGLHVGPRESHWFLHGNAQRPAGAFHPRPLPKGVASIIYFLCNTGGTGSEIGPRQGNNP